MKKAMIVFLMICCLALAACGGSGGSAEKVTQFESLEKTDDQIKGLLTFDQSYDDISIVCHSDINNDTFEGTAEYIDVRGAVDTDTTYNIEIAINDGWTMDGTFKGVSFGTDGQPHLEMPDISKEKITVTVKNGDEELISQELE